MHRSNLLTFSKFPEWGRLGLLTLALLVWVHGVVLAEPAPTDPQFVAGAFPAMIAARRAALRTALHDVAQKPVAAGEAMVALARAHLDMDRYLDAEPLLIAARQLLASTDSAEMAEALAGLARVAMARGDTQTALSWATKAAAIARRIGPEAPSEPIRALGAALAAAHRFGEAEQVLHEAVAHDRARCGPRSIGTARSLAQLGNLYLRAGRPGEALAPLEEATAIDQSRLAAGHPFIADDLHDLGLAYEALHRSDLARRTLESALAVLDAGAGRDTPRAAYVESDLSRVLRAAGDEAGAEAAFRDARRILNRAEAAEHKRERQV